MAAFMFMASMVCLCLGGTNYAMVFGIASITWMLNEIRDELKVANQLAIQKRNENY
jgi:hypothetical protein